MLVMMEPSDAYGLVRAKRANLPTVFQARTSMGAPFRVFSPIVVAGSSRTLLSPLPLSSSACAAPDSASRMPTSTGCVRCTARSSRGRNRRSSLGCCPSLRGFEPCGLVRCFQQTPLLGLCCRRFPAKGSDNTVLFRVSENRPGRPDSRRVSLHGLLIVAALTCVSPGDSERTRPTRHPRRTVRSLRVSGKHILRFFS